MRRIIATGWTLVVASLIPLAASAQNFGVRAGVSGSPDQFYAGVHVMTSPVFDHVRFRPNVEIGFGSDEVLVALNLDLVWRAPIRRQPWSILMGGGPAANIVSRDRPGGRDSTVGGGFNILLGLEHDRGFFAELKAGLIDSPSVKFGIGYTF